MSTADTIRRSRPADGVLHVTIDRPEKRNAIDRAMLARLAEVMQEAGADPAVRAVVLSGTGPVFSAGVDLAMLAGDVGGDEATPFRARVAGMGERDSSTDRTAVHPGTRRLHHRRALYVHA